MKTDAELQQDVLEELAWDATVQDRRITVQVEQGVVTLAGQVGSVSERLSAARAAQRVGGVKAVAIDLQLPLAPAALRAQRRAEATDRVRQSMGISAPGGCAPARAWRQAADVGADIEAALRATSLAAAGAVAVCVRGQDVTLSGTVQSWDERHLATNAAWGVPGVRNVIDLLRLAL